MTFNLKIQISEACPDYNEISEVLLWVAKTIQTDVICENLTSISGGDMQTIWGKNGDDIGEWCIRLQGMDYWGDDGPEEPEKGVQHKKGNHAR